MRGYTVLNTTISNIVVFKTAYTRTIVYLWLTNTTRMTHLEAHHILFNPLSSELNPICHLLALLGAHHIFHVSRIRVNLLKDKQFYY